jgi:hypothetical protein
LSQALGKIGAKREIQYLVRSRSDTEMEQAFATAVRSLKKASVGFDYASSLEDLMEYKRDPSVQDRMALDFVEKTC